MEKTQPQTVLTERTEGVECVELLICQFFKLKLSSDFVFFSPFFSNLCFGEIKKSSKGKEGRERETYNFHCDYRMDFLMKRLPNQP